MSRFPVRLFDNESAIVRVGEGLLTATLPRSDWTHEAHLAACSWLVVCQAEMPLEVELPSIIRRYNVAVGGVNDDSQGYHETLTQLYLAGTRAHFGDIDEPRLLTAVNALLSSARGKRDWPLHFYSKERLFSVAARRYFLTPDRRDFADAAGELRCHPRIDPVDE
jgi:hypothetical protein